MTVCHVCEDYVEDVFYFTDEIGDELEVCQHCFEKMKKEYRKGRLLIALKNNNDMIEIWYDDGTYIFILSTESSALVDEITF